MYSEDERHTLLRVAEQSIVHGLDTGVPFRPHIEDHAEALREPRATFVTLELQGQLRGCIGTLEAFRPLVVDVADNAFAAAFSDPRFPPLRHDELDGLSMHISILSPATPIRFSSEDDLINQLRPGLDGLILEAAGHRGTFLPSVWESLPQPRQFLLHLKQKARLPMDYWSDSVRVFRYTTESFGITLPITSAAGA